jgi:hypothetical protein
MRQSISRRGTVLQPDSCKGPSLQLVLGISASGGRRFLVPPEAETGQSGFERAVCWTRGELPVLVVLVGLCCGSATGGVAFKNGSQLVPLGRMFTKGFGRAEALGNCRAALTIPLDNEAGGCWL